MKHYIIKDRFYPAASGLREEFENKFSDPRKAHPGRFVWDYWYIKDQYRFLRTPAWQYFKPQTYVKFHSYLVQWGRENLGCHDVSPPWLSCYFEGCGQNLHSDVPHGPWAWVFSLSPKRIRYQGGETLILRPTVLNYWQNFLDAENRELNSFVERIPSPFNRLTVFDPRFPHGVTEVRGVEDPLEGRLVIHGWFVEPRPYVVGPLTTKSVKRTLDDAISRLQESLLEVGDVHGTISLRLTVGTSGAVRNVQFLTNTIVGLREDRLQKKAVTRVLLHIFQGLEFMSARSNSLITVPILFK
ncbi:MAG: hypothetical protein N2578_05875 [Bdellovibrionaceae bacterium]|nr:hypothetical protein [Pseudobdellovibrionaceae bacterium]